MSNHVYVSDWYTRGKSWKDAVASIKKLLEEQAATLRSKINSPRPILNVKVMVNTLNFNDEWSRMLLELTSTLLDSFQTVSESLYLLVSYVLCDVIPLQLSYNKKTKSFFPSNVGYLPEEIFRTETIAGGPESVPSHLRSEKAGEIRYLYIILNDTTNTPSDILAARFNSLFPVATGPR